MRTWKCGVVVVFLAATAGSAIAATPASKAASAAEPDGYATKAKSVGKEKTDAMAQLNEKMGKCKAMYGDEKKGCEEQAKRDAKNASTTPTQPSGASDSRR
jgi:hypothetical protein